MRTTWWDIAKMGRRVEKARQLKAKIETQLNAIQAVTDDREVLLSNPRYMSLMRRRRACTKFINKYE